jgi:cytochrome o ubiquinol oxidase operon protein cyoD
MSEHHHGAIEETTDGLGRKSLRTYLIGFILCLVVTCVAFAIVGKDSLSKEFLYVTVSALAIIQLIIQVLCFLRLNASEGARWNLIAFLFTILIIIVIVAGSLWIMWNLNYNMMH